MKMMARFIISTIFSRSWRDKLLHKALLQGGAHSTIRRPMPMHNESCLAYGCVLDDE
jgi:hypothetical protein